MLEEVRFLFTMDVDGKLRRQTAQDPDTPLSLLLILATEDDWKIRLAVAKNDRTPKATVKTLAEDTDARVRVAAKCHLEATETVGNNLYFV